MPKIICHDPAILTGQVGSVPFVKGQGETEDPTMLEFFAANPDRFDVLEDEASETAPNEPPAPDADEFEAMKVEQLRKACTAAGLPTAGDKAALQARLREHKASQDRAPSWRDLDDAELLEAYLNNVYPEKFDPENPPAREVLVDALEALDSED